MTSKTALKIQMPHNLIPSDRVFPTPSTSTSQGRINLRPIKTMWIIGHGIAGITGIILFPSITAFLTFITLTAITICAGHSVGMHRLLIHRSFQTPRIIEYILVYLGTLVGMAGPFGMIHAHDMRDWHQRQKNCPPHPAHNASFFTDAYWQLCCTYDLKNPPEFRIEKTIANDPIYQTMERTWMLQQLPLALVLFALGGWGFVLWGISLRIFISLTGHWMVGHFAHKRGEQTWRITGLDVQGYNLPKLGLITFGENWHGNHHAFPHSAQLGIHADQLDPGFLLIKILERMGLAWAIKLPNCEPPRHGLTKL
jgi:stearoyl-CoA desaturase (delta-9 desaturase)